MLLRPALHSLWQSYRSPERRCAPTTTVPAASAREQELAEVGLRALHLFQPPLNSQELAQRHLVIDLLDLLCIRGAVPESPLAEYTSYTRTFEDQFRFSWHALCLKFPEDRELQKRIYNWGASVYRYGFREPIKDLAMILLIWERLSTVESAPIPTSAEIALPRLMASRFDTRLWQKTTEPPFYPDFHALLRELTLAPQRPLIAASVQWRRIRHYGLPLFARLVPSVTSPHQTLAVARACWIQTCLYYMLLRGKLDQVMVATQTPSELDQALRTLDAALAHHILHLTPEVTHGTSLQ